ncbi:MAG: hypothetical protein ACYSW3_18560 [Planctomycetota bacterium]|jgi:hypothetical protein
MFLRKKINTRPNSLGCYPDFRRFAVDLGLNLSRFASLLFDLGFIFSEKKPKIREITYKAGPCISVRGKG